MKFPLLFAVVIWLRAQSPAFEVASVRLNKSGGNTEVRPEPGRLTITNMTLRAMVQYAYEVRDFQVSGGPSWFDSDHWDVSAAASREVSDKERRRMLEALLIDRFQMTIRRDTKELPVYALVVAKNGPKLTPNKDGAPERIGLRIGSNGLAIAGVSVGLPKLADTLFNHVGRLVQDRTGIQGRFDFNLEFVPDATNTPRLNGAKMEFTGDGPSIFTAVQEQLGLKLESTKGPVEVLFVDRAMRATEN